MRSRNAEAVRVLGLVGLLLGCGSHSQDSDAEPQPSEHTAEVALEVENHGWSDIVVSLVRGTSVERLGMVGGLKSETFVFPYRRLGAGTDVRLRAYPIGRDAADARDLDLEEASLLVSSTSTTEPTPTTPSSACSTMTAFSIRLRRIVMRRSSRPCSFFASW